MSDFLQAARHTNPDNRLPHQDAAWNYAWDCLSPEEREEFLVMFRAAVDSKKGEVPATFAGIAKAAAEAGARYGELVAAQAALESGWFKTPSGRHNYWGLKGKGTVKRTWEVVDGKTVEVDAEFADFASVREGILFLVDRWYKDFARGGQTYRGVNRQADREDAARELVRQGYATDPGYADKLVALMNEHAPRPKPTQASIKAEAGTWRTKIKALNLSQPDASSCQAACIGMAVGDRDVAAIRARLQKLGAAGSPSVMSAIVRTYKGVDYLYEAGASLRQVVAWLKAGELLVTHGWFTRSGHVIVLDGVRENANGTIDFDVKDPWSEFNGRTFSYDGSSRFFDGYYSDRLIYATCVAGSNWVDARYVYENRSVDLNRTGMWVHRFRV